MSGEFQTAQSQGRGKSGLGTAPVPAACPLRRTVPYLVTQGLVRRIQEDQRLQGVSAVVQAPLACGGIGPCEFGAGPCAWGRAVPVSNPASLGDPQAAASPPAGALLEGRAARGASENHPAGQDEARTGLTLETVTTRLSLLMGPNSEHLALRGTSLSPRIGKEPEPREGQQGTLGRGQDGAASI